MRGYTVLCSQAHMSTYMQTQSHHKNTAHIRTYKHIQSIFPFSANSNWLSAFIYIDVRLKIHGEKTSKKGKQVFRVTQISLLPLRI